MNNLLILRIKFEKKKICWYKIWYVETSRGKINSVSSPCFLTQLYDKGSSQNQFNSFFQLPSSSISVFIFYFLYNILFHNSKLAN